MDQPNSALNDASAGRRGRRRPRPLAPLLGNLFAVACLVWLFHDVDWRELLGSMRGIRWRWVAAAILFDILSYICQGWRWELLLRPVGRMSPWRTTQAIYAGLFTNEILPMRVGELVRAYLVSRWMRVDFSTVVPSLVVERFFDGIWLAISIGVVAVFVPLPANLAWAADVLGVVVLLATAAFFFVVVRKRESRAWEQGEKRGWNLLRFVGSLLAKLERGLREIGSSRFFYLSLGISVLLLLGQVLAYWLIMWAYGLQYSFWVGAVVLLIVHLGTSIPNAPANVGTYQFFTVVGLRLFGVDKDVAAGFSLVVFFLLTAPLWALGSFALNRSGLTLAGARKEIGKLLA